MQERDAVAVWECVTESFRGTTFGRPRSFEELSVDGDNNGARRIYDSVGMTVNSEMHRWDLHL